MLMIVGFDLQISGPLCQPRHNHGPALAIFFKTQPYPQNKA